MSEILKRQTQVSLSRLVGREQYFSSGAVCYYTAQVIVALDSWNLIILKKLVSECLPVVVFTVI